MRTRARNGALLLAAGMLAGLCLAGPVAVRAGTTGKIAGQVLDPEGRPVVAATITVAGTRLGAYSDEAGNYTILNVPAGTYELRVNRIGFETVRVQDVLVTSDQTTRQDVRLGETTIKMQEVVVTAERPPVDLGLTSTKATVTSQEIQDLPVQDLEDVVNLQAGVVEGHFRGGRLGEVQYQVDGVSVNNAFDNKSMVQVDRSLLQEVQVISGTFDAEYGQAMSGVVNAVLKQGTPDFRWNAEVFTGGFAYDGPSRLADGTFRPTSILNLQGSLSGPLTGSTVYLVNARHYRFDDWIWGTRAIAPGDTFDFATHTADSTTTADGGREPIGYTREWSGVVKLTNTSLSDLKLNYQALANYTRGRRSDYAYRLLPDALSRQRTFSISHGLDATYTVGPSTFADLSLRQNYIDYRDAYDYFTSPDYTDWGPARTDANYLHGSAVVQGLDFTRFVQKTNSLLLKSSLTSQVNDAHLLKVGGEVSRSNVLFGTPGYLVYAVQGGQEQLLRYWDRPPDYPAPHTYRPLMGAAYAQDQMEWPDLTLRVGARLDVFDPRSEVPSDLANPANVIPGAPPSRLRPTTSKVSLSPRLGVAYPIEDKAAIHFAYGHFYQFPAIGTIFSNADFDILANLQAGGIDYGVLGNPDIKPEQTVQYEIGYKHALSQDFGVELTTFYKDIRDLLGVEFVQTYNGAEYAHLTNVDFGSVFGVTVALDHRRLGPVGVALDYTWQEAKGNASDPRETAVRAEAGEDPRPRLIPFDWDQRHTLNLTLSLDRPDDYSLSAIVRVASGQPYTPLLASGFGRGLEANSGRKPTGALIDLRAEKSLTGVRPGLKVFARVFNLLDTRFFNGGVFASTGSPYYSRFSEADWVSLHNPTRFYAPRRLEIGVRIDAGGS